MTDKIDELNEDEIADAIDRAYNALDPIEKQRIDQLAKQLEMSVKAIWKMKRSVGGTYTKAQFGRTQALELLAKLGVWMLETNPKLP